MPYTDVVYMDQSTLEQKSITLLRNWISTTVNRGLVWRIWVTITLRNKMYMVFIAQHEELAASVEHVYSGHP